MISDLFKGQYSSVWDVDGSGREHAITTDCEIDPDTGVVYHPHMMRCKPDDIVAVNEVAELANGAEDDMFVREYVKVEEMEFAVKEGRINIAELADHLQARGRINRPKL